MSKYLAKAIALAIIGGSILTAGASLFSSQISEISNWVSLWLMVSGIFVLLAAGDQLSKEEI